MRIKRSKSAFDSDAPRSASRGGFLLALPSPRRVEVGCSQLPELIETPPGGFVVGEHGLQLQAPLQLLRLRGALEMGLIRSCVGIWSAANKPTLNNQQVCIATAPTAPISTAMSFGFVEAGHQNVLTLSPCLKTLLQELQVMAARKRTRHTPGVALHRGIKPFGLEIKSSSETTWIER